MIAGTLHTAWIAALLILLSSAPASAEFVADSGNELQANVAAAIQRLRAEVPRSEPFFEDAYAIAVMPSVTRIGIGFGGAYGKGLVIEGDAAVGRTSFWQFTSGIQAGIKNFTMILFFKDKLTLDIYKQGNYEFLGQAGIDVATWGIAGTPTYNEGVAIITMTRLGLMGEFTISGAKFTYNPDVEI